MQELAQSIYEIIKGYRNDDGIYLQPSNIIEWAEQFNGDGEFVLSELLHLLKQVYLSREDAVNALRSLMNNQYVDYGFTSVEEYLQNTCFLCLQPEGKSQHVYLDMFDEIVFEKYGHHLSEYNDYPKNLFVYLDDILASGGTIRKDLMSWLSTDNHAEKLKNKEIRLEISLICVHTWGLNFLFYGLQRQFGNLPISYRACYEIQNHLKLYGQDLNIAIPTKNQPKDVLQYLAGLDAEKYEEYAFRDGSKPLQEKFFTSPGNRVRFENIILEKGLYIINQIQGQVNPNIRPLGLINPNYRTFGLGTHFFTWRNIPNNCPLVYWWDVPGHNWKPLFPAKRTKNE